MSIRKAKRVKGDGMKTKIVCINGQAVALFPEIKADFNGNILSYAIIGQHGAASQKWLENDFYFDYDLYIELMQIYDNEIELIDCDLLELLKEDTSGRFFPY